MKIARIYFNSSEMALPEGEHVGDNLRAFFGVKRSHDLFRESDRGGDTIICASEKYHVGNRDRFYSVSRKINQS